MNFLLISKTSPVIKMNPTLPPPLEEVGGGDVACITVTVTDLALAPPLESVTVSSKVKLPAALATKLAVGSSLLDKAIVLPAV